MADSYKPGPNSLFGSKRQNKKGLDINAKALHFAYCTFILKPLPERLVFELEYS